MSELLRILLLLLPAILHTANGNSHAIESWCFWSSDGLSDMEYIRSYTFNKINYVEYNSTLGKYVGYTEIGIKNAERWNNNTAELQTRKANVDRFCKNNAQNYYSAVLSKAVEPQVEVTLVKKSDGTHPARLMCSAYSFYPPNIEVTWLRNGKEIEGGVTSTEEMADGDWYYQIHSHLEYMPESGEEISCVVQHASFQKPMVYKWDPSMSEPDKSKIAIGASGLVLGIVLSAAGFIYYRKKCSGQWKIAGNLQTETCIRTSVYLLLKLKCY
ncbi:H-2 class II histocompatibility antigen, E-S beta chain-like [Neoarius graeffei]|uniref:H-2 class II histocompatibility antigen, E-S beta chain-like n=1 Tax=Neoarius graeffei TaxID=443677 RepID=UPI00298CB610|nr:H-2 class II histocompatibility antigen, E-S beta chain-like [Neoarius graeffei]